MNILKRIVARLHSEAAGKTVTSEDWSGKTRTLVHEGTGKPVTVGETVTDFRGDKATVTGGEAPHKQGSTGRVYVKQNEHEAQYFPSVFELEWK